jgi:K+-sensing histidine kinase KdpD
MRFFSFIHVLLLAYIIAALSFWWMSLEKQSRIIYNSEIAALKEHINAKNFPLKYEEAKQQIDLRKQNRSNQYLGEGLTFLLVILIGSSIVYTTYRFSSKLSRQQNNFMLSVTHELKSPIAAMKLTLQTLQRHQLDEEKQQQLLGKCVVEADRLNELCNNILIASQMEGGQYANEWQKVMISDMVHSSFEAYNTRYPNRFVLEQQGKLIAETDKMLLQLVLNNVMENAIKYTPSDSKIELYVGQENDKVIIAIKDAGQGISDEEKKKIFNQFYRIGDENTRKTKGTGLGLYLSKKIMKSLKGSIVVKDNLPQGSIFEISLPISMA